MKKLISFALLIITSISSMAQSTDFLYPFGRWSSPYEEGKGYTELYIVRERNGFYNYYNMRRTEMLCFCNLNCFANPVYYISFYKINVIKFIK